MPPRRFQLRKIKDAKEHRAIRDRIGEGAHESGTFWHFNHEGSDYFVNHFGREFNLFTPGAAGGFSRIARFTYASHPYLKFEGKRVLFAFASSERRVIRDEDGIIPNKSIRGQGFGSVLLRLAENECYAKHSKAFPKEPLVLSGDTDTVSILRLFLRNGYSLLRNSWRRLAGSDIAPRLQLDFKEGNERELLKQLDALSKASDSDIELYESIYFYREMKEPNEIE